MKVLASYALPFLFLICFYRYVRMAIAIDEPLARNAQEAAQSEAEAGRLPPEYLSYLRLFNKPAPSRRLDDKLKRFIHSMRLIAAHNAENKRFNLSLTEFADLTAEELEIRFKPLHNDEDNARLGSNRPEFIQIPATRLSLDPFHENLNWASDANPLHLPLVGEVNSQGACGACWAFVTASSTEAAVKLSAYAQMEERKAEDSEVFASLFSVPSLSAQQLIDCDREFNNGCNGGNLVKAMNYVVEHGLVGRERYSYVGKMNTCPEPMKNITRYFLQHVNALETNSDRTLFSALQRGPVGVGLCGTEESFLLYSGGIYDHVGCCKTLNHALLLVGYGFDSSLGARYWIALNSWGKLWGERGYVRLLRQSNDLLVPREGICGLYLNPVQGAGGYVQRADGSLAYTGDSRSFWSPYYYDSYRFFHYLSDHSNTIMLMISMSFMTCSGVFLVYSLYLEYLMQCRRHNRQGRGQQAPDRRHYQAIPDRDVEAVFPPQ